MGVIFVAMGRQQQTPPFHYYVERGPGVRHGTHSTPLMSIKPRPAARHLSRCCHTALPWIRKSPARSAVRLVYLPVKKSGNLLIA